MISLRLAIDNILMQWKRFLISGLLVTVSLTMLIFSVLSYAGQSYAKDSCNAVLSKGMEETGVLYIGEEIFMDENGQHFLPEAYETEEIGCIGESSFGYLEGLDELYEIQKHCKTGLFSGEDGYLKTLIIDDTSIGICKMELAEGTKPEALDFENPGDESIRYLYLGAEYDTVPIGTEYRNETYHIRYIVAGRLQESQRWIDPHIVNEIFMGDLDLTVDCDYAVLEVGDSRLYSSGIWITPEDGYTLGQAIDKAYEVAEKYGGSMQSASLMEMYERSCEDSEILLGYLKRLLGIILPTIILMLLIMQIVAMLLELKNYGILYSVGYTLKDIGGMLIWKNLIMCMVALAIAAPIVISIEKKWFAEEIWYIMETVMLTHALPVVIVTVVTVVAITSITAIGVLKAYTPVQLMRHHN